MHKVLFIVPVILITLRDERVYLFQRALHDNMHLADIDLIFVHLLHTLFNEIADELDIFFRKLYQCAVRRLIYSHHNFLYIEVLFCVIFFNYFNHALPPCLKKSPPMISMSVSQHPYM